MTEVRSLRDSISRYGAQLDSDRNRFAMSEDDQERTRITQEILRREAMLPKLQDSLDRATSQLQKIEMEFLFSGVVIDPDKVMAAADQEIVGEATSYTFTKMSMGGKLDMTKVVAVAGSEAEKPCYKRIIAGAAVESIVGKVDASVRVISGDVLTGVATAKDGYLAANANMVTLIPEGDKYEFMGWAMPRFHRFSVSGSYFSWLFPKKSYNLDTNTNGEERAFVVTGLYEKYLPMDIYPMHLLKAIMAGDLDKMEALGIYEVVEEDFALCEFVDPSKIDMQQVIRNGINLMIKEGE